ncbi:MAG: elongation factor 1-beta [Candidatus Aenigmarchaeota archaeon]|nr:elongation factor 1-beta [Candidatus Aenigmarchaeota archaeon]
MGDVAITFRLMPASRESNLNEIKKEIEERVRAVKPATLRQIAEKPIAFGLRAIDVLVVVPDSFGPAELEETLRKVQNIASIETENVTLI